MEMNKKDHHHQFYVPWYAADEHADNWMTYIHRNLHHLEGEGVPFPDSEWTLNYNNDDAKIHDQVLDTLYCSDKVDASQIKVVVIYDSVTLSGMVNSEEEKAEAERVVRELKNVWSVTNELVVRAADAGYHF